jgi:hypothetical protein
MAILMVMSYPGGKAGDGIYQRIISLMPPHEVYIEPFLGGGAILRHKKPARRSFGLDLDAAVIAEARTALASEAVTLIAGDGLMFLKVYPFAGEELVYCDPPYLLHTRASGRLYRHEMTDDQHAELLEIIRALPCRVMISGYWSPMYEEVLKDWTHDRFPAMTRGGRTADEWLWFNFPRPLYLHDYRYLGSDYREREQIKRKKGRWIAKLRAMPMLERQALLAAIGEAFPSGSIAAPGEAGASPAVFGDAPAIPAPSASPEAAIAG